MFILVEYATIETGEEITETLLIHQIGYTSRLIINCINRIAASRGYEISHGQMPIMMMLRANDSCPQNDIVKTVMKEKATVTRLINSMEKNGLLTKIKNPDDRRNNLISLTDKGRDLLEDILPILMKFNLQLRLGLEDNEIKQFDSIVRKIQQNIISCEHLFENNVD